MTSYSLTPRLIILGVVALIWGAHLINPIILPSALTVLALMILIPDDTSVNLDDEYPDFD